VGRAFVRRSASIAQGPKLVTIRLSPDVRRTQFSRTEPHSEGDSPSTPDLPTGCGQLVDPGNVRGAPRSAPPSLQKPTAPLSPCRPASVAEGRRNLISQAPLCQSLFSRSLPILDRVSLELVIVPFGITTRRSGSLLIRLAPAGVAHREGGLGAAVSGGPRWAVPSDEWASTPRCSTCQDLFLGGPSILQNPRACWRIRRVRRSRTLSATGP
jgi:hypothetical protein